MSFPAEGVESAIKNNIEEVRLFLDSRHAGHYAVYNLSKRSYRSARFHNRVRVLVCVSVTGSVINLSLLIYVCACVSALQARIYEGGVGSRSPLLVLGDMLSTKEYVCVCACAGFGV